MFVEQETYRVSIRWRGAKEPVLLSGRYLLDPVGFEDSDRSEYQFNFASSVGFASLQIGHQGDALTFEVLPKKIEYRTDYRIMKRDLASQAHSLAFDVLGRTEERAKQFRTSFPTEAESYVIANSLLRELLKILDLLEDQPHTTIRSTEQVARFAPGARLTIDDWKRLTKRGPNRPAEALLIQRSQSSLQTFENSFVKWTLLVATRRLSILLNQLAVPTEHAPRQALEIFAEQVRSVYRSIRGRARVGFLAGVEARPPSSQQLSLVFLLHPLYRLAYHVCLLLLSGLELEGYVFQMGVKDVATLYEYWSFLAVISILQRHARLESSTLVKVEKRRAALVLRKGRQSRVLLRKSNGAIIVVSYNAIMEPTWTTPQRPDAVIEIASEDTRLILDAKYRLQFDEEYIRSYGGPGPMEDDINKMHRYRDSVLFASAGVYVKAREAVALFPLPKSVPYAESHKLHASLDIVGVGGLPSYPDNLAALESYLVSRLKLDT